MKNHLRSLVAALTAAVSFIGFGGTTYYVSPTGDGSDPTAGFATGYQTIKAAIENAADSDVIILDKTTFDLSRKNTVGEMMKQVVLNTPNLTIMGAGKPEETILDGGDEGGTAWNRRIWDGYNPGFKLNATGITLKNMTFVRLGANQGGALYMYAKGCVVENIIFRNTGWGYAANQGGNCYIDIRNGIMRSCVITNNCFSHRAISLQGGSDANDGVVENCYIADNDVTYDNSGNPGVVRLTGGSYPGFAYFRNNTVVNNKTRYPALQHDSTNMKIVNNIAWGNVDPDGQPNNFTISSDSYQSRWMTNCVQGISTVPGGIGNLDLDPKLADDNLHLTSASPCCGKGDPGVAPLTDIEGVERAEKPCIGCSEFVSSGGFTCEVQVSADKTALPETITLSVAVTGAPVGELSYAWDLNGDGKVDSTEAEPVLAAKGKYQISVVVSDESGNAVLASHPNKIFLYGEGRDGLDYYVSPTGDGTDPTAGFATAFPTLKRALAEQDLADGDMIILDRARFDLSVDNNLYEISTDVNIEKRLTVTGVGKPDETILDGGREYDGRRWGSPRHWPSFNFKASGIVFRNMTFERMGSDAGSAIYVPNGDYNDCVISNMIFRNTGWGYENWGNAFTAHVTTGQKNMHVSCCVFTNNVFPCAVLAMTGNQNALLENCYFANNICTGVKNDNGVVNLNFGGFPGLGWFRNNTVVNNRSKSGAVQHDGWSNVSVLNSIIYGNTDLEGLEAKNYCGNGSRDLWKSCCIGEGPDTFKDASNIFANPGLADDGMHLKPSSLCIGKADPAYAPVADIEGVERSTEAPCIGCSEFVGTASFSCSIMQPEKLFVMEPETIQLQALVEGNAVAPLSYSWDLTGNGYEDSTEAGPVLSDVGAYKVSVTITDANGNEASAGLDGIELVIYSTSKTHYVVSTRNPNERAPYASWETAASTLDKAAPYALTYAGSRIILGDGVHTLGTTVLVTNGMTVTSLNGSGATVVKHGLAGGKSMFVIDDPDAVVERLALTAGKNTNGGGVAADINCGTLRDVVITNFANQGQGVVRTTASSAVRPAMIERMVCTDCRASNNGTIPGVYLRGYTTMENCLLARIATTYPSSWSWELGSALSCVSANVVIRNCTFADNDCLSSHPLHFTEHPQVFENNIVSGNTTNGQFVANGLLRKDLYNVLVGRLKNVSHCCIDQAQEDYSDCDGMLTCAPGFVGGGDYRLTSTSPCVGKGVNGAYTASSTDIDGRPRIRGRKVDLGCYECQKIRGLQILVR